MKTQISGTRKPALRCSAISQMCASPQTTPKLLGDLEPVPTARPAPLLLKSRLELQDLPRWPGVCGHICSRC